MNLETVGGYIIALIQTVGEAPAVAFLQSVHDKNIKLYRLIIYAVDYGLSVERVEATKTATGLDDKLVVLLQSIITGSASANGITL